MTGRFTERLDRQGETNPMAESSSQYIHGTDPVEQARLASINDLLNAACLQELALTGGERILDVGSGLGQFARAMARAAKRPVVGIERSPEQLAEAKRLANVAGEEKWLELRQGDVAALPLADSEWGTFDVAFARFLLEHVPDPLSVVRTLVRAVRPGGRVVLADDDHDVMRLHPEPPGLRPIWEAFVRSYDRNGNDPFVGRRLPSLLHQAGAIPVRARWVFFGGCSGEPRFEPLVANLAQNLRGAREPILATGMIDAVGMDVALAALEAWGHRPDAAIWYATAWAEGRVGG